MLALKKSQAKGTFLQAMNLSLSTALRMLSRPSVVGPDTYIAAVTMESWSGPTYSHRRVRLMKLHDYTYFAAAQAGGSSMLQLIHGAIAVS